MINIEAIKRTSCKVPLNAFFATIILLISPIYSLPFIIKGMVKMERWAFVYWSILMGLIGILVPPSGDFYRYTCDFQMYNGLEWEDFCFAILVKNEILLPLISYLFGNLGLNFDLTRFLYNFIGTLLHSLVFLDIIKGNKSISSENKIIIFTLIVFFSVSVSSYIYRYCLSTSLFVYGAYKCYYKNERSGWFYILISVTNHFSFIIQAFVFALVQLGFFNLKRPIVSSLVLASFIISPSVIISIFSTLPFDSVEHYMAYLDGKWAGEYLEEMSLKFRIQKYTGEAISYILLLAFFRFYYKGKNTLIVSLLCLVFVFMPFDTIKTRFFGISVIFIKIFFFKSYDNSLEYKRWLVILATFMVFSHSMTLWKMRREYMLSDMKTIWYSTTVSIVQHTYTEEWIDNNITEEGDFIYNF